MGKQVVGWGPGAAALVYLAVGAAWRLGAQLWSSLDGGAAPERRVAVEGWLFLGFSALVVYALGLLRQHALLRHELLCTTVLTTIPDAAVVCDEAARPLSSNPAADEVFGAGGPLGAETEWRTDEEGAALGRAEHPIVRALGGADVAGVYFVRAGGAAEGRWYAVVARPARGDGVRGAVLLCHDVTALRRAEAEGRRREALFRALAAERGALEEKARSLNVELERRVRERTAELEASMRELADFSSAVSHDLRAPLRSMSGFASAILEDHGDALPGPVRERLSRIVLAARRMGEIIDALLDLARVSQVALARRRVDVGLLALAVVEDLRGREPGRKVEFSVRGDGLVVRADPALLRIVLENLLGNAWKFTGGREMAHVSLSAERAPGEIRVCVRDDGAGFDMAWVNRLFRPFERLHPAREFPGSGIGLATVARIVERHGGRVWAEGVVGGGAAFGFSLPENGDAKEPCSTDASSASS